MRDLALSEDATLFRPLPATARPRGAVTPVASSRSADDAPHRPPQALQPPRTAGDKAAAAQARALAAAIRRLGQRVFLLLRQRDNDTDEPPHIDAHA